MFGLFGTRTLAASIIFAFISITSYILAPATVLETAMMIDPPVASTGVGDTFTVNVIVNATTPVNAFAGEVQFDPTTLEVTRIDYNNSIADLWAKLPWYQNGEGTINFAGGTTVAGGFIGKGSLITITFATKKAGITTVLISGAQILKHDGFGSDATIAQSVDNIFTVIEKPALIPETTIMNPTSQVMVGINTNALDLNQDGNQSLADISIFMQHLVTKNKLSDFNQDGSVSLADLSILMESR